MNFKNLKRYMMGDAVPTGGVKSPGKSLSERVGRTSDKTSTTVAVRDTPKSLHSLDAQVKQGIIDSAYESRPQMTATTTPRYEPSVPDMDEAAILSGTAGTMMRKYSPAVIAAQMNDAETMASQTALPDKANALQPLPDRQNPKYKSKRWQDALLGAVAGIAQNRPTSLAGLLGAAGGGVAGGLSDKDYAGDVRYGVDLNQAQVDNNTRLNQQRMVEGIEGSQASREDRKYNLGLRAQDQRDKAEDREFMRDYRKKVLSQNDRKIDNTVTGLAIRVGAQEHKQKMDEWKRQNPNLQMRKVYQPETGMQVLAAINPKTGQTVDYVRDRNGTVLEAPDSVLAMADINAMGMQAEANIPEPDAVSVDNRVMEVLSQRVGKPVTYTEMMDDKDLRKTFDDIKRGITAQAQGETKRARTNARAGAVRQGVSKRRGKSNSSVPQYDREAFINRLRAAKGK